MTIKSRLKESVVVAYTCNPNYLEGVHQEDHNSRTTQASISTNQLCMVEHSCLPSHTKGINRRIMVQCNPGKNVNSF
jgi:hypothetical protein